MNFILFHSVTKLNTINEAPLYTIIKSFKEINSLSLKKSKKGLNLFGNLILISCTNIEERQNQGSISIKVENPILLTNLKKINEDEECLIVIKKVHMSIDLILGELISDPIIGVLIENNSSSVSRNSTKAVTRESLERILTNLLQDNNLIYADEILSDLIKYFHELIERNKMFFPKNLKEFKKVKESTVIHTANAWYVFIRFFLEQWEEKDKIIAPDVTKRIKYYNWEGIFFDRENPIWNEIYSNTKRYHYPSLQAQVEIYNKWCKF